MQPLDDSALDQRLRRYYDAIPTPPSFADARRPADSVRAWKRWALATAAAAVILCGTAVAARDDVRATAMRSIERMLYAQFAHPVREAKQIPVRLEVVPALLAQAGLELPRGLPSGARLSSMRAVNNNAGWVIVTYRVPGRSGEAIFSIASTRTTASSGGNVFFNESTVPSHVRFASWETAAEHVMLVSRGDALTDREIAKIKAESTHHDVREPKKDRPDSSKDW